MPARNYLEHINDIFSKLESVTEQLQERYGRSIIRLNVPSFFANEYLLPRLASFSQAREETDIRIETTFSAPKTHPPEADLSIVVGAGPWDGLVVHEICSRKISSRPVLSGVLVGQPHRHLRGSKRQDFVAA